MKCPVCQSDNRDDAKFCDECGYAFWSQPKRSSTDEESQETQALGTATMPTLDSTDDVAESATDEWDTPEASDGPEVSPENEPEADDGYDEVSSADTVALPVRPSPVDILAEGRAALRDTPHAQIPEREMVSAFRNRASGEIASGEAESPDETPREEAASRNTADEWEVAYEPEQNVEPEPDEDDFAQPAHSGEEEEPEFDDNFEPDDEDFDELEREAESSADFLEEEGSAEESEEDYEPSSLDLVDRTADLTGLERLVDSSYVPPRNSRRSGDTREMEPVQEAATSAKKTDFRAERKPRRMSASARVAVVVIIAIAAIAAAIGGITYTAQLWGGRVIPEVNGESEANATYVLEQRGFKVSSTAIKSDDVEGIVLLSDPSQGTRAEEGTEVVIHVSVARIVPNVVGMPQPEAAKLFENEGFERVEYVDVKSNEAQGKVLSVSPEAGTKGKATTPIKVEVAIPFVVPAVSGMTEEEARGALEAEGYVVNVATDVTDEVPEGRAVSTEPAAGTQLNSGSEVTLYIAQSKATALVNMATNYLSSNDTINLDGVNYVIDSIDDVVYTNGDSVEFVATGRATETVDTLLFGSYTIYGDPQTIRGYITFGDDGSVIAVESANSVQ